MKHVVLYTRGTVSAEGKGGWAAVMVFDDFIKELSGSFPEATPNRAELTAVIEAINGLKDSYKITVLTCSEYVVVPMRKGWVSMWWHNNWQHGPHEVKNSDLWDQVLECCRYHRISWNTIPERVGTPFTIRAKYLAEECLTMPQTRREFSCAR